YNVEEMTDISDSMFRENNVKLDRKAKAHLKEYFAFLYKTKDKYFGNGRAVRKVVEATIKNQHLRLAQTTQEDRTPKMIETITIKDVESFVADPNATKSSGIGFKRT